MRIVRDFTACPESCRGAVVGLGNFDGVHLGHRAILSACTQEAKKTGATAAVMTFEPHPREFFGRGRPPLRLSTLSRKLRLLEAAGIGLVFLARFNKTLAATSAQDFVTEILHRRLNVSHIVTGYDFAFGKGRQGDTAFLENAARALGIGFTRIAPVASEDGKPVSSSAIRELLKLGKVSTAARFLGRPYALRGRVVKGDGRGKTLGFPTANIPLPGLFLPRLGIYAARLKVTGEEAWSDGAASLGIRPMFALEKPLLEMHVFDAAPDLYGQKVDVELVEFLRDEKRFIDEEALCRQMEADCRLAKSVLQGKEAAYG